MLCKALWGFMALSITALGYIGQGSLYHHGEQVIVPPTGKLTLESGPVIPHETADKIIKALALDAHPILESR